MVVWKCVGTCTFSTLARVEAPPLCLRDLIVGVGIGKLGMPELLVPEVSLVVFIDDVVGGAKL